MSKKSKERIARLERQLDYEKNRAADADAQANAAVRMIDDMRQTQQRAAAAPPAPKPQPSPTQIEHARLRGVRAGYAAAKTRNPAAAALYALDHERDLLEAGNLDRSGGWDDPPKDAA